MIKGLFAVTIKTSDLKKLSKFYTDVIGLDVEKSSADIVMLKLGDGRMLVLQDDAHIKPVSDAQTQVRGCLAFEVSDLEAAVKRLKSHKVKLESPKAKKGGSFEAVTSFDPDGNRVDFVSPIAAAA